MSYLGGILGRIWSFVKNFFEGHTSSPPRSAFAPPAPLCNEPGYLVYLRNLLCVNLLQHWYTCFCVAMSVENSVFGVHFWRGGFVYILRKWIFIFTTFLLFLRCLILSYFTAFCPFSFFSCFVLLFLIRAICPNMFRYFVPDSFALLLCLWVKWYVS